MSSVGRVLRRCLFQGFHRFEVIHWFPKPGAAGFLWFAAVAFLIISPSFCIVHSLKPLWLTLFFNLLFNLQGERVEVEVGEKLYKFLDHQVQPVRSLLKIIMELNQAFFALENVGFEVFAHIRLFAPPFLLQEQAMAVAQSIQDLLFRAVVKVPRKSTN